MDLNTAPAIIPIILSGGSGSRLWPLSRDAYPKPFIKLIDGQSLLQKTFMRASSIPTVQEIMTVTNQELFFHSHAEYQAVCNTIKTSYILEPFGRGTAPAIAAAVLTLVQSYDQNSILIILPADHLITDENNFITTITRAITLAKTNSLVTIGIPPISADSGYGYLEINEPKLIAYEHPQTKIKHKFTSYNVCRFIEKPDLTAANEYLQSGKYLWNSGIFVFNLKTILSEMEKIAPEIIEAVRSCLINSKQIQEKDNTQIKLNENFFIKVPDISIDYGIMEKSSNLTTLISDFEWNDLGSWNALSALTEPDQQGNRVIGNGILHDTTNCYIHGDKRLISTVGVENLAIIDTSDALLVLNREHAQSVKHVVHNLKKQKNEIVKFHRDVQKPWGSYNVIDERPGFKIKLITVKPGAALSLQMHHHRSEHWIIISGTAFVTKGEQQLTLTKDATVFIPAGEKHRLKNAGTENLILIEIQCGEQLNENDIIRYADEYNRIDAFDITANEELP